MIGNLVAWLAQSTLLAGVAILLPWFLRVHAPRVRLIFWQAALLLVVVLPLIQPWHAARVSVGDQTAVYTAVGAAPAPFTIARFEHWLPHLLLAGALLRLAWLGLGLLALERYRSEARAITPTAVMHGLMARLGVAPRLAVSDRVSSPVTFGIRHPMIVLPAGFRGLRERNANAAVCHELIHVARRDAAMVLVEELVRAFFWFLPGAWLLLDRIALAREQVVDQRAVALTGDRKTYFETLYSLAAARGSHRHLTPPAVAMLTRNQLLARIRLLTQETIMTPKRIAFHASALACATLLVALVATTIFPLSAIASSVEGPIYVVEGDIEAPKRQSGEPPAYPVDAMDEHVTGKVVLRTVIDREGTVADVKVVASVDPRLSRAAIEAVRDWRFAPATKEGAPVDVYYNLTINYRLPSDDEDADGP